MASRAAKGSTTSFFRLPRLRKAWCVALLGGVLIAWSSHRYGGDFLWLHDYAESAVPHLAAPGGESQTERRYEPARPAASGQRQKPGEHSGMP
ncbi:hypothetical protein OpiT1DRAFT_05719 [Opitutaceae bacterium TAV1]|nr:hypothetical protein OpiT1DRAFT_05719 [Opitutaceae bacterium TAV1]